MPKISYTGYPDPSVVILAQFGLEMCCWCHLCLQACHIVPDFNISRGQVITELLCLTAAALDGLAVATPLCVM